MVKPKVGDYVRITQEGGEYSHHVRQGALVEVIYASHDEGVSVKVPRSALTDKARAIFQHEDDISQSLHKDDYELTMPRRFKAGDFALYLETTSFIPKGATVEVEEAEPDDYPGDLVYLVRHNTRVVWVTEDALGPVEASAEVSEEEDEGADAEDLLELVVEELRLYAGHEQAFDTVDNLIQILGFKIKDGKLVEVEWTD